jgi:hypothetical protein
MKVLLKRLAAGNTVKWVLVALAALVVIDGLVTNLLVNRGIPFLSAIAGGWLLIGIKAVGATACAFIIWDIFRHWHKLGLFCAYAFLFIYTLIVFWNCSLLIGAL